MTRPTFRLLAACAALTICGAPALAQDATTKPTTTLRQAAKGKFIIGCAIMASSLGEPRHAALIAGQFDSITAENEMKPESLQRNRGAFTFDAGDKLAAFAASHDMKLVGHTLLWHSQTPKWLFEDAAGKPLARDVALANLKEHMTKVMAHYKGKVMGWDVVNEAVTDNGEFLRDTPARKAIGDDYVIQAFKIAHEADPDVELYYNDYNIEAGYKIERGLRMIRELKAAGCRVDAVGIQGHWLIDSPSVSEIGAAIDKYAALGVKVHITELDVDPLPRRGAGADVNAREQGQDPFKAGLPAATQEKLAARYGELFKLFVDRPGVVTRVTLWGTHDGTSWLNDFPVRGRTNHALLFDRDLKPKAAVDAVIRALQATPAKAP